MQFMGLGLFEIGVIAVLALIFIGPERLPDVARNVFSAYRQVRALGSEWRDQVEREVGQDLRGLTRDVNQGLEAFGRSVEREIQAVDSEIKDAQALALEPPLPPSPEFPALPPLTPPSDFDDETPSIGDYRPG